MVDLTVPILTGAIGIIGTLLGGIVPDWLKQRHLTKTIQNSLAAEIDGIVRHSRALKQAENALALVSQMKTTGQPGIYTLYSDDTSLFTVFQAVADKIGSIDASLAARVVAFYQSLSGLLAYANTISGKQLTAEDAAFLESEARRYIALMDDGERLASDLRNT